MAHEPDGYVEKDYTAVASDYDRTRYAGTVGQFVSRCELAVIRRAINSYAKHRRLLVDIACGTGHFTFGVADLFDAVVGIDFTHAMLSQAQSKALLHPRRSVAFVQGSTAYLPVRDESCDVVLSTRFMHLFPRHRHQDILTVLMRPLRSGGVLLVDHDTSFVEWRARHRLSERKRRFSYHATELPLGARLVARLGVSGPRLAALSFRWPVTAQWLSKFFVYPPLNRVSTQLVLVYRKL
jgi:ubiquinone/menaquinone biosynthesis C-methylase UbiE